MATAVLTNAPTSIADGESITGWSGDTFALEPDIKVEGSNSVACAQTASGNNDAIFTKATGSWDFSSGEHLRIWFNSSAVPTYADIKANGGIQVGLGDGSNTDYFYVGGSDFYSGGWEQIVLYTLTTPDVDNGADLSVITSITFRMSTTAKPRNVPANLWLDAWTFGDGFTVTGGTSGDEIDWSHVAALDKVQAYGIVEEINGVFFFAGEVTVGAGATTTFFKETGQLVVFKDLPVLSTLYQLIFEGSACNVDIDGGVYTAAGSQVFKLDVSDPNLNAFDMDGKQVSFASSVLFYSGQSIKNSVFAGCGQVSPGLATFEKNTVSGYTDTAGALLAPTNFNNLVDCAFNVNADVTNDPAGIEHAAGGTFAYDNLTFLSNDYDILNSISAALADSYSESNQDTDISLNGTNLRVGQTFTQSGATGYISHAKFHLKKVLSPTGNAYATIYALSGGTPTGAAIAVSEPLDVSTLTTGYVLTTFEFEDGVSLTNGVDYGEFIEYADGDGSNYVDVGVDNSTPSDGGVGWLYTTSWASQTWDVCFYVYVGGLVIINASNGANPSQAKIRTTGTPAGVTAINNPITHKLTGMQENSEVTYTKLPTASDTGTDGVTSVDSRDFATGNSWSTDEHKGRLLVIETGVDAGRYYIVSNTATTLKLDAELTAAASSIEYSIYGTMEVVTNTEDVPSNGENSYAYTYGGDAYVDIIIFHINYEDIVLVDILLGSTSQTIPIGQTLDVNYFNPS